MNCSVKGCTRKGYALDLCRIHYMRQREGLPMTPDRRCKCGCGKQTKMRNGRRTKYHSPACWPKNQARAKKSTRKYADRLCVCGCGRWFTDTTFNQLRKYYEPNCRPSIKGAGDEEDPTQVFRKYICRGFDINGGGVYRGMCENHDKCIGRAYHGGKWKYETNRGKTCYKQPRQVNRVNSPNSVGLCSDNSSYC